MKLKRLVPFALALSLLAGCGNSGGAPSSSQDPVSPSPGQITSPPPLSGTASPSVDPSHPAVTPVELSSFVLAQAVYPEFPTYPEPPADGESWNAWSLAEREYLDAVTALRADCDPAQVRGCSTLLDFAGRSTPLALAGHEGENAIYSPLSLWSALALEAQCANGNSQAQVLDALGVADTEQLRELVRQIWLCLYTDDGRDALTMANSIWLNDTVQGSYVPETLDTLAKDYFSSVYSVPMGTGEADQAITDWISQQTNGLIGSGGPVVQTEEITLALLASSLYYRAGWKNEFYEFLTEKDTFTCADGRETEVEFMHKSSNGLFLLRDGYQAAYLATRLGEMVFVLPDEGVTPESLLDDPDFLKNLKFIDGRMEHADPTTSAHWGEVQWSVPKFDVDSNLDLLDTLTALGITDLLDPDTADLSNLTGIPAYLSKALQLARVKVDEEGVEAAAVTILIADAGAAMPPEVPEVCVMDLDRPFLFVVRSWDLPLFVGVVNQVG